MYAMDEDQAGDWLGWIQDDFLNSGKGLIAADIVRKLKSWNGFDFVF